MDTILTPIEARVLGVLIEKGITTPDYYPLTLNSTVLACNQKSNRNPVMNLDDNTVLLALNSLSRKHLVLNKNIEGNRVLKYAHDINCVFELTLQERGVLCVLFLRGNQTPGEINTRTNRICEFKGVAEVEEVLNRLMLREDGPFVKMLPRKPGNRECRYAHLFCGDDGSEEEHHVDVAFSDDSNGSIDNSSGERIEKLEEHVASMQREIDELKLQFVEFKKQFE